MTTNTAASDVSQRIKAFNNRLLPDKVQAKYKLMADDPFRFYRGTCHLFYEDLSKNSFVSPGPSVWMCGDLHLENFGSYKGDNRLVYFDVNDFDESLLGPASWEMLRMVTSIFLAFDSLHIDDRQAMKFAKRFLQLYSATLVSGKPHSIEVRTAKGIVKTFLSQVGKRSQAKLLRKRLTVQRKKLVFRIDNEKQFKIEAEVKAGLIDHITEWANHHDALPYECIVRDACFRVAGTGSLGLKRYMFVLESVKRKKMFWLLDMKQSRPSSLNPYITLPQPGWQTDAERVTNIKLWMQDVSPALLSTTVFNGDSYVLQELQPSADKLDFRFIKDRYDDVGEVIRNMASVTASAQLRSSGRQGSSITDELIEFGQKNNWENDIIDFALEYRKKVKTYYEQYVPDFKNGFFSL